MFKPLDKNTDKKQNYSNKEEAESDTEEAKTMRNKSKLLGVRSMHHWFHPRKHEKRKRREIEKRFTGSLSILRAMVMANGSLILPTSLGRNEGKAPPFPSEKTPPRPRPSHFAAIGVLVSCWGVSDGKPHFRVMIWRLKVKRKRQK